MGGKTDPENPAIQSKGVNITSDSLLESNAADSNEPLTLNGWRDQVQTVIEHMGPNTPQFAQNTSSEADNEESVYESTSLSSSINKVRHASTPKSNKPVPITFSTDNSVRERSEQSVLVSSEVQPSTYSTVDQRYSEMETHYCQCDRRGQDQGQSPMVPPPPVMNGYPYTACDHYGCGYYQQNVPVEREHRSRKGSFDATKKMFSDWIQRSVKKKSKEPLELYKINITQPTDDHSPPRKLVFDLIDDIPKPDTNTIATNTKPLPLNNYPQNCTCDKKLRRSFEQMNSKDLLMNQKRGLHDHDITRNGTIITKDSSTENTAYCMDRRNATTRVDVYYFDHGNAGYYKTTDTPPVIMTELLAERTEIYTTRFWAELFGTVHIGFAFFTSFILQLLRFILYSLFRPLIIGLIQLTSDYFFKPLLAVLFNAVLQPPLIFLFNIATSLRDLCGPIAEGIGYFLREIAVVLRAIRLVEVKNGDKHCYMRKKDECYSCTHKNKSRCKECFSSPEEMEENKNNEKCRCNGKKVEEEDEAEKEY